jgi:hypothetical protein
MSIEVQLDALRGAVDETDRAPYFLTVGDDARPHCVATEWRWHGDELVFSVGNRTLANARARSAVAVLWPPRDRDGYSLIVDGIVSSTEGTGAGDNLVRVRPVRAVLHRPAVDPTDTPCGSDCLPLLADG